jgi:hypothetical protein
MRFFFPPFRTLPSSHKPPSFSSLSSIHPRDSRVPLLCRCLSRYYMYRSFVSCAYPVRSRSPFFLTPNPCPPFRDALLFLPPPPAASLPTLFVLIRPLLRSLACIYLLTVYFSGTGRSGRHMTGCMRSGKRMGRGIVTAVATQAHLQGAQGNRRRRVRQRVKSRTDDMRTLCVPLLCKGIISRRRGH